MKSNITSHTIVKNEDRWIWYAIMSVIDSVDKMLIIDTGSTDNTVKIIKAIKSPKIEFNQIKVNTRDQIVNLRKLQLKQTKSKWFMLLDGDEIWPKRSLQKLLHAKHKSDAKTLAFFTYTRNCVGDILHYLPESKGRYKIKNRVGNLNIRLIKNIKGLNVVGKYPLETYTLKSMPIQQLSDNIEFVNTWYLHTTHLSRSTKISSEKYVIDRLQKRKFRLGKKISEKDLPKVLWKKRPNFVPAPITQRWRELFRSVSRL